jgi:hypothetical protein
LWAALQVNYPCLYLYAIVYEKWGIGNGGQGQGEGERTIVVFLSKTWVELFLDSSLTKAQRYTKDTEKITNNTTLTIPL